MADNNNRWEDQYNNYAQNGTSFAIQGGKPVPLSNLTQKPPTYYWPDPTQAKPPVVHENPFKPKPQNYYTTNPTVATATTGSGGHATGRTPTGNGGSWARPVAEDDPTLRPSVGLPSPTRMPTGTGQGYQVGPNGQTHPSTYTGPNVGNQGMTYEQFLQMSGSGVPINKDPNRPMGEVTYNPLTGAGYVSPASPPYDGGSSSIEDLIRNAVSVQQGYMPYVMSSAFGGNPYSNAMYGVGNDLAESQRMTRQGMGYLGQGADAYKRASGLFGQGAGALGTAQNYFDQAAGLYGQLPGVGQQMTDTGQRYASLSEALSRGQLDPSFMQNFEKGISGVTQRTTGDALSDLASRGVLNSTTANRSIDEISRGVSEAAAQNYLNAINTAGGQVNNAYSQAMGGLTGQAGTIGNAASGYAGLGQNATALGNSYINAGQGELGVGSGYNNLGQSAFSGARNPLEVANSRINMAQTGQNLQDARLRNMIAAMGAAALPYQTQLAGVNSLYGLSNQQIAQAQNLYNLWFGARNNQQSDTIVTQQPGLLDFVGGLAGLFA